MQFGLWRAVAFISSPIHLFGNGIMTIHPSLFETEVHSWNIEYIELFKKRKTLCYNNRPPTLSLIPVIYNSLGQNKSKELELWSNNKYEIRPYIFQKISSGPTDSDYKIRDGSRFIEWGLASEGVWGIEMAQPPVHFWTVNWLGLRKKGACQVRLPLNPPLVEIFICSSVLIL